MQKSENRGFTGLAGIGTFNLIALRFLLAAIFSKLLKSFELKTVFQAAVLGAIFLYEPVTEQSVIGSALIQMKADIFFEPQKL